jgi:hypothetical protein
VNRRLRAPLLPLAILLWLGLGTALAVFTSKVANWFVMTDELLYERLAISIANTDSPLPRVHAAAVSNINQLYPLLIAPAFRNLSIADAFHQAHILNAFVMSSAAIPAYLLARRLTSQPALPFVVAVATVTVPWITLSSFLLTEVAAYPAFVWALLGIQACVARPSTRNDLLAVAALALAVLGRTQFYALVLVLPAVVLADGLAGRRLKEAVLEHRALVVVYTVGALCALVLAIGGHPLLGTYAQTAEGNPLPPEIVESVPAHLAVVALAGGLLPFLLGGAWAVSNLVRRDVGERRVFAWLTVVTVVVLTVEVASFNLRFGGGLVRERYLFYLTPLLLCAFVAALTEVRLPRWSLLAPLALVVVGFWRAPIPTFEKLNVDTPASVLYDWLLATMHGVGAARLALILAAVVLTLLVLEGAALVPRGPFAIGLCSLLLVALVAETGYAFKRLFAVDGTSGLPLTLDQSPVFGWIDGQINGDSVASIVPYPILASDYWSNVGFWWDLEFWNRSVQHEVGRPDEFSGTPGGTFPKSFIRFDPRTGAANVSYPGFAAQSVSESRFRLAGQILATRRNYDLIRTAEPWRADWVTSGLYDDGWTRPGRTGSLKIFAQPGQRRRLRRSVTFALAAPAGVDGRLTTFRSNLGSWSARVSEASVTQVVSACVPPSGFAEVTFAASGVSPIPADPKNISEFQKPRTGGVLFQQIALADEVSDC